MAVVEAAGVERREEVEEEVDVEGLSLPTFLLVVLAAALVLVQELLEDVLVVVVVDAVVVAAAVEEALFHADQDQGDQGEEGEIQLPLHHDDQTVHEEENLHHAFQNLQEAYIHVCIWGKKQCVCMCIMYVYALGKLKIFVII